MGKILLYIAIVITFISAGLGVVNALNKKEVATRVDDADRMAQAANQKLEEQSALLTEAQQKAAAQEEALAKAEAEAEKATQEVQSVQQQVAAAKQAAEAEKNRAAQISADMAAKDQKIAELSAQLANQQSQPQDAAPSDEMLAQIQEKDQLLQSTEARLAEVQSQLTELQTKERERAQLKMRDGLEGRVLAVNPAWNFVVLSLGDRNGVISNSELLVKRGTQLIGKVRVTAVEPNTSIADIVAKSIPNGYTIQPGDDVIYRSVDDSAN